LTKQLMLCSAGWECLIGKCSVRWPWTSALSHSIFPLSVTNSLAEIMCRADPPAGLPPAEHPEIKRAVPQRSTALRNLGRRIAAYVTFPPK
jgi:hypothetical protein